MKPVIEILEEKISAAMAAAAGLEKCAAIVKPASDPKFGDYQVNGVMSIAKQIKTNPRKLAEQIVEKLDISDICETPEIAGPGFINLRLKPEFLESVISQVSRHYVEEEFLGNNRAPLPRYGVDKVANPKTIVVDFSGPNIAKEMHVGHLRSTIIGDCICRMLQFLGNNVIPQNHIGDWGTQFGMLCALLSRKRISLGKKGLTNLNTIILADLESFYREAKQLYDKDENFAKEAREAIAGLHKGNNLWIEIWKQIVHESEKHYRQAYDRLKVHLYDSHTKGESEYRHDLQNVVDELKSKGLAVESDGAICVFPEGFKNKEGEPLPFIIQKSDGAYLYATTDLAAIRYRVSQLHADEIVYVTDARQKLHFEMLFAVARKAGWVGDNVELRHVMFGSVLGENGQPLKTRSGENVKLKELLEEAVERAKKVVDEKNPELSQEQKEKIAQAVGIGAVKYADYSNNRTSDYVFSFDKMLAMEGNTAPYMQYAYARISSIMKKGKIDKNKEFENLKDLNLSDPSEIDLAKHLIRYGEAIQGAAGDFRPNYLTSYLYELAQKFSTFYTSCPVLKAEPEQRRTRLLLCDLTARTIRHGLTELLGIEVVEQM